MKIVLWGTYDTGKPRIRILRDGLRELGVEVTEIHANIWEDLSDKSSLRGARNWLGRGLRLIGAYPRLIWRYLRTPSHDLVLVSYPGQLDVLVLRVFAWMRRKPIVFDWFISAYDTIVDDRRLLGRRNPLACALRVGEWLAARTADLTFMDTAAHARRMERLFRLNPESLGYIWVGAEPCFFGSAGHQQAGRDGSLHILFYGQFIPLHGIETIVEAARLARNEPILWTLIGRGQEAARIRDLLDANPLPNVTWIEWVPYGELPTRLAAASVCLGIFGTSDKAASVIPNKVFQILASGRPLITRDSNAVRELLGHHPPPGTQLTPAGDATALVDAVRKSLASEPPLATDQPDWGHSITRLAIATQFANLISSRLGLR